MNTTRSFLILTGALLLTATPLVAQHNSRVARDLQFRFGNPGARSMGFGGAFIGLADDATAPIANPAGMSRTQKRSVSFELGYASQDNDIPFLGGEIFQSNIFEFDFNLTKGQASESQFQVPYLAAVFPLNRWRLGFLLHQQADLQRAYSSEAIRICHLNSDFYPNCSAADGGLQYPPSNDVLDMTMWNAGASAAYAFSERFSLGASLFFSSMDYRADSEIEFPTVLDTVLIEKSAVGEDEDFGAVIGLLWRMTDDISLGLVYKDQPEFAYQAVLSSQRPLAGVPADFQEQGRFKIPDSFAIGFSINPMDFLTINFDANRVYYSQISDNLIDFNEISSGEVELTQTMPDVTEIHIGLEWLVTQLANPLAIRLGYWLDPYHALTNNVEDSQLLQDDINLPTVRDIFFLNQFAEDNNHFSFGLGWTFGARFQLDAAFEISDNSDMGTVSGIYRF